MSHRQHAPEPVPSAPIALPAWADSLPGQTVRQLVAAFAAFVAHSETAERPAAPALRQLLTLVEAELWLQPALGERVARDKGGPERVALSLAVEQILRHPRWASLLDDDLGEADVPPGWAQQRQQPLPGQPAARYHTANLGILSMDSSWWVRRLRVALWALQDAQTLERAEQDLGTSPVGGLALAVLMGPVGLSPAVPPERQGLARQLLLNPVQGVRVLGMQLLSDHTPSRASEGGPQRGAHTGDAPLRRG